MIPMELPEDWEAIDPRTMALPESENDSSDESCLPPTLLPQPQHTNKSRRRAKQQKEAKRLRSQRRKERKKARASRKQRRKRKPVARNSNPPNSLCSFLKQQDCTIERPPVFTNHARKRLHEGRSGEFVTKKKGNAVVVVTILPSYGYPRQNIESIRVNRKKGLTKYKVR